MSVGCETWARAQKLDGWAHARHAALEYLARMANHEGIATPSVEDVARAIDRSVRDAQRLLSDLEREAKIQRFARFMPRQVANAYRVLAPWIAHQLERRGIRVPKPSSPEQLGSGIDNRTEASTAEIPAADASTLSLQPGLETQPGTPHREATAESGDAAAFPTDPRRHVYRLANGDTACIHQSGPACQDCLT